MTQAKIPVKAVVGLGNPGERYRDTRHNVGFWLVDELARQGGAVLRTDAKLHGEAAKVVLGGRDCWLLQPNTFMNKSGQAIGALARYYRLEPGEILVVHDELDLEPGTVRLKRGGGHGGHNGLRDTIAHLGSKDFLRLRLGIGHPGDKSQVVNYVLARASASDESEIRAAMDRAVAQLDLLQRGEIEAAMQRLHG